MRDAIMGRAAADIDIATDARWQEVQRICEDAGVRTYETGVKHGTLTVAVNGTEGDGTCEVTTFRSDGTYTDARHPDSVTYVDSIEEDLARRDFTMNAIAYNPDRGFCDPYGGVADIQRKTIRTVGDAAERFSEDALRILRGVRFSSQMGFSLDKACYTAMLANKNQLSRISTERITHELDTFLMGDYVHSALIHNVDVLAFVLPELAAMKGCAQVTKYHAYDVLEHTAYAVQYCPKDRALKWAALCHDIGKPAAAFFDEDGVEHFYGHADVSAKIARGLLDRLLMSNAFKAEVVELVANHNDVVLPTKRSVRRALVRLGGNVELFRKLIELKRADMLSHAPRYAAESIVMDDVLSVLDELLENNDAFCLKKLAIHGDDLLGLGLKPGRQIGRLLNSALDAVAEGRLSNEKETLLDFCKNMISGE